MSRRSDLPYSEAANRKMLLEVKLEWSQMTPFEKALYRYFLSLEKNVDESEVGKVPGEPWMAFEALTRVRKARDNYWRKPKSERPKLPYSAPRLSGRTVPVTLAECKTGKTSRGGRDTKRRREETSDQLELDGQD